MKKFECYLCPTNEGHDMNYSERFSGTFGELESRCRIMQIGLQNLLSAATIKIKIETLTGEVVYDDARFFKDGEELNTSINQHDRILKW